MERLLIVSTCLPPRVGGLERVVWELSKRLVQNYEVHIITTEGGKVDGEQFDGVIHHIPRFPLLTLAYSGIAKHILRRALDEVSPEIIHSHAVLPWGYVFRSERPKKIITCHGSQVYSEKRYLVKRLLASALNHADRTTVASRWLREYMQEHYDLKPELIPNGVDTQIFRPVESIQRADNVVLYVGRFLKHKGILNLMEAARMLPVYEFWLAGASATESLELPSLPNVKVLGVLTHPELARLYSQAAVAVFPSYAENFPLAGLEAMACGTPIVATKLGFSEYVEDGLDGLLIEPRDTQALASSIQRLLKDDQTRRRLGENARRKALRYDWNAIAEQYVRMYRSS